MKKTYYLLLSVLIIFSLNGCGSGKTVSNVKSQEKIMVFAAASLTESFTEIAKEFEKQEGVKVDFNFAGSQTLRTSLENGATAQIFASASIDYMDELKDKGLIAEYEVFLKNRLILIKNKQSEFHVKNIKDLTLEGMRIAVGDDSVPIGKYWSKALTEAFKTGIISSKEKQDIEKNIKTKELSVKDVVSKVLLNEVDVGVVYATDLTESNSSKVVAIDIPLFEKFTAVYPIAIIKGYEEKTNVDKFYKYVFSKKGMEIFRKYKFITD